MGLNSQLSAAAWAQARACTKARVKAWVVAVAPESQELRAEI